MAVLWLQYAERIWTRATQIKSVNYCFSSPFNSIVCGGSLDEVLVDKMCEKVSIINCPTFCFHAKLNFVMVP